MHGSEGLWMFLTICGVAGIFSEIVKSGIKARVALRSKQLEENQHQGELLARMEKLERRMANLETIVLESEKRKQFDRAL